LLFFFIFNPID